MLLGRRRVVADGPDLALVSRHLVPWVSGGQGLWQRAPQWRVGHCGVRSSLNYQRTITKPPLYVFIQYALHVQE